MQKRCEVVLIYNASFKARVHRAEGKAQMLRAQLNVTVAHRQERQVGSCRVEHKGARHRREPIGRKRGARKRLEPPGERGAQGKSRRVESLESYRVIIGRKRGRKETSKAAGQKRGTRKESSS